MNAEDIDWPEDPLARIEAKIDNLRDNHLSHVEQRFNPIEQAVTKLVDEATRRKRWSLLSGLASASMLLYLVLR